MEKFHNEASIAPAFKLTDLEQLYKTHLEQLGGNISGCTHTSKLKLRMLSVLSNLKATMQGKNVVLSFEDDFGDAI